ncbi:unnamed protein product [Strongylus vulgaris]|uniref:Endonuclease/exonuclease/phosphatase domain-containing protein n=1 Tax=Strongylus vulgaris TaxID=40348 RepID=A0A3P7KE90_STRVU|nr:unnamed protein product [Strongylus vulgaris]
MGDFNAKIGIQEEGKHRIARFGTELRNENGNRLVKLLSTTFSWQLHLHEKRKSAVDMGITQRYDSCGDRPHSHQSKVVLTGRLVVPSSSSGSDHHVLRVKVRFTESWRRKSATVLEEGGKSYMTASDWRSS